jgi:pyroglutamyl-peptidase
MIKILVTGFDAFGGEPVNPALEAVRRLPRYRGDSAAGIADIAVVTREIPTVFDLSRRVLADAIAETAPDIVLGVGQAGGRPGFSIERVAINIDDARIPDNAGNRPIDRPIEPEGPAAYFSTLPIKALTQALRDAGIPAEVSQTAGTFVCNHLFYGLMHLVATHRPGLRGGFIHIPLLPEQAVRHPGQPSMAVETIVRGLDVLVRTAAVVERDITVAEGKEC